MAATVHYNQVWANVLLRILPEIKAFQYLIMETPFWIHA